MAGSIYHIGQVFGPLGGLAIVTSVILIFGVLPLWLISRS